MKWVPLGVLSENIFFESNRKKKIEGKNKKNCLDSLFEMTSTPYEPHQISILIYSTIICSSLSIISTFILLLILFRDFLRALKSRLIFLLLLWNFLGAFSSLIGLFNSKKKKKKF